MPEHDFTAKEWLLIANALNLHAGYVEGVAEQQADRTPALFGDYARDLRKVARRAAANATVSA